MTIEFIFLRFWRAVSLPLLVAIILIFYFTLPDMVAVHHTDSGKPDGFINKQQFFYYTAAIVLISNILTRLLAKSLSKAVPKMLPPNSIWSKTPTQTGYLAESAGNFLSAAINTFMFLCLVALSQINGDKDQILRANYNWLFVIGGLLVLGAIFYLPLRLLYGEPEGLEVAEN